MKIQGSLSQMKHLRIGGFCSPSNNNNNNNNNSLHLYSALSSTQSALHCEGVSPRPPPVCTVPILGFRGPYAKLCRRPGGGLRNG